MPNAARLPSVVLENLHRAFLLFCLVLRESIAVHDDHFAMHRVTMVTVRILRLRANDAAERGTRDDCAQQKGMDTFHGLTSLSLAA
ncbi:MAG TPA: hypothetical protein VGJ91_08930 [Polyangiaceae bacterium]